MKVKNPEQYKLRMKRQEVAHMMSHPDGSKESRNRTENLKARYESGTPEHFRRTIKGQFTPHDRLGAPRPRSRRAMRAIVAPPMDFRSRFVQIDGIFGADQAEVILEPAYVVDTTGV